MKPEVYTDLEQVPHPSELSFGESLVENTFYPSGDDKVAKAKQLCAELADLLHEAEMDSHANGTFTGLRALLTPQTYSKILDAQMMVVKVLTLR